MVAMKPGIIALVTLGRTGFRRHQRNYLWRTVTTMLIAGLVFLVRLSTPAQTASSSPCGAWQVIAEPDTNLTRSGGDFHGVAILSDDDAWFVGDGGLTDAHSKTPPDYWTQPLMAHWDGHRLAAVPAPRVRGDLKMWKPVALAKDDVWAIGTYTDILHDTARNTRSGDNVLFHWDGARWSLMPGPSPPEVLGEDVCDYNFVRIVPVAKNDTWAFVRYEYKKEIEKSLIQRWDGARWSVVPAPDVGDSDWVIAYGAAVSSDDVWAIGWLPDPRGSSDYLMHWNGAEWSTADNSRITSTTHHIRDIAASRAGDVWVVGFIDVGNGEGTFAAHWEGKSWSIPPTPNTPLAPGEHGSGWDIIHSVAVISPDNVWAVVSKWLFPQDAMVLHWDGARWSEVPGLTATQLYGVSAAPNGDVWVAGEVSTGREGRPLAARFVRCK